MVGESVIQKLCKTLICEQLCNVLIMENNWGVYTKESEHLKIRNGSVTIKVNNLWLDKAWAVELVLRNENTWKGYDEEASLGFHYVSTVSRVSS